MTWSVPDVVFRTRARDESIGGDNPFRWQLMTTRDYFEDKRVLIFSLPGAFTPTCSTMQVPGFEANYDLIRSLGIDEIYVVSVNDAFVMRKWMLDQKIEKLKFIPDGNGEFTEGMGMLVDKSNLGFGHRSWRYAAVVDNMRIEKVFSEPGLMDMCLDDPYGVTSPENVIEYLKQRPKA
jgi:thioredoxin-dependent peroxiredoxin